MEGLVWSTAYLSSPPSPSRSLVKNCCDSGTVVPEFYTQARKGDADNSFPFHDAPPQGVLVYLGTK